MGYLQWHSEGVRDAVEEGNSTQMRLTAVIFLYLRVKWDLILNL